jgi:hypothetical protein
MRQSIQSSFITDCKNAISRAKNVGTKGHAGVRGNFREIIVNDILKLILTDEFGIASGVLTDTSGNHSKQIDTAIYYKSVVPLYLYDNKNGLIPVESCIYTVEIKSKLTKLELTKAISNAKSVLSLKRLKMHFYGPDPVFDRERPESHPPVRALIAFSSDLKGSPEKEIARYRLLDPSADTDPMLRAICIVGRGYWYFGHDSRWKYAASNENSNELIQILAGISNSLVEFAARRGRPKFGYYLLPEIYTHVDV